MTLAVCKKGCTYETVQAAINAAQTNDNMQIGAGSYFENLTAGKALTLLPQSEPEKLFPSQMLSIRTIKGSLKLSA